MLTSLRIAAFAVAASVSITAVACSDSAGDGATLDVAAGFYPLGWVASQVGGDRVRVTVLAGDGVEPHDLELSPLDVGKLTDADLVINLPGFQPAVDDAIGNAPPGSVFDVSAAAQLEPAGDRPNDGLDPHFWLDPLRLSNVGTALADELARLDPDGAADYQANAAALAQKLKDLDRAFTDQLSTCADTTIVTSHGAFQYLARRYGFDLAPIAGLSPSAEPSPRELADIADVVKRNDISTIYFESLVSPRLAQTIAAETGAKTAMLDPVEGLTDKSSGDDYIAVMEANLATLRKGQRCS